jgi:hypothetical protein
MTVALKRCSKNESVYMFDDALNGGCGWKSYLQNHVFTYSSNDDSYAGQNLGNIDQNYEFIGENITGLSLLRWNQTYIDISNTVFNRAIGNANDYDELKPNNQASNSSIALEISDSYLLGLQGINSTNSIDTNTTRPQLYTSYRKENDHFSGDDATNFFVKDDDTIMGARARTGQKTFVLFL